ncbi:MAG: formaldehyde-activating enzyme [Planctomycetaceae bacterium]|nr:formaldehyde-activating enzyme [Planctomycetaceae bacterium]
MKNTTSVLAPLLIITAVCFAGCNQNAQPTTSSVAHASESDKTGTDKTAFYVGEALVGEGNEVAHIDVMIGTKSGPVGIAFANAMANQKMGHSNVLIVLEPNTAVKPSTIAIPKVTASKTHQAVQLFGPAQSAIAKAVAESVQDGVIPKLHCEDWVIVCGIFIHWEAEDNQKIFEYNYEATKLAIKRAVNQEPSANEVLKQLP